MRIGKTHLVMLGAGLALGLGLAAVVVLLGARAAAPADDTSQVMKKDGFDFTELRAPDKPWRGPEIGEKIDLTRLRGAGGRALSEEGGEGPLMLVAVDPTCAMCGVAADTMKEIEARLSSLGVPYYMVAFVPVGGNFHAYAGSLGAGRRSLLWPHDAGPPPDSLLEAVQPSHILVDRGGTVLRVWPGSNRAKPVRDRMAAQIVADASVVVETLAALSRRKS